MSGRNRGFNALSSLMKSTRRSSICPECVHNAIFPAPISQYSVAAPDLITTDQPPIHQPAVSNLPPVTASSSASEYRIQASVVLSRPPLLTAPKSPFETAFYLYQKRLNERLVLPFSRYFYYKDRTPAMDAYRAEVKARDGIVARDVGRYNAYGKEGWNDEVLVGDSTGDDATIRQSIVKEDRRDEADEETRKGIGELGRLGAGDLASDQRLDRKLDQTIYLVVKKPQKLWTFPKGEVMGRESLSRAARRILDSSCGVDMNTWLVGNAPAAHQVIPPYINNTTKAITTSGRKTFFMRGRILAGQVHLEGNEFGWADWKWLTKDELQGVLTPKLYASVSKILADR